MHRLQQQESKGKLKLHLQHEKHFCDLSIVISPDYPVGGVAITVEDSNFHKSLVSTYLRQVRHRGRLKSEGQNAACIS